MAIELRAAQLPQQLSIEIVGADAARRVGDDFSLPVVLPDVRRRPAALLVALDAPDLLAGSCIERHEKRLLLVVAHDVQPAVMQHRRRRSAPAGARGKRADGVRPDRRAVHVEGEDADVAKVGVDPLAISDRRLGGKAVLEVPRALRRAPMDLARPADSSGVEIDAVHHPTVLARRRVDATAVEIDAGARFLLLDQRDHGRDEDPVAPNDRRAPAESGDVGLPGHVLGLAPAFREPRVFGNAGGVGTPELRPLIRSQGRGEKEHPQHESSVSSHSSASSPRRADRNPRYPHRNKFPPWRSR